MMILSGCGPGCNPVVGTDGDVQNLELTGAATISTVQALIKPTTRREVQVWYHCLTLQQAVEDFAARNQGLYPYTLSQRNLDGDTVIDLLPFGTMLMNPFHQCFTEPVNGASAQPGEVGYVANTYDGRTAGYTITGSGKKCHLIVSICKSPGYNVVEVDIPGLNPDGTPILVDPPVVPPPAGELPAPVPDKSSTKMMR
jgi:hypothetical protein